MIRQLLHEFEVIRISKGVSASGAEHEMSDAVQGVAMEEDLQKYLLAYLGDEKTEGVENIHRHPHSFHRFPGTSQQTHEHSYEFAPEASRA